MKPTERLHNLGQSLWLDNITRPMLREGVLEGYIRDLSVTGLTSNPSIFEKAISGGDAYDEQIAELAPKAAAGEGVGASDQERIFFELALADLRDAADLFADVHRRTAGVDGFVSLEVSPLLADDAAATIEQAKALHAKGERDNIFIKIPGTQAGREAIEETIFAGVPVNVTLLFMSRWDVAVGKDVPDRLVNRLGIAIGGLTQRAFHELRQSDRMLRLMNEGARPQRLLWASTGTKDPDASDTLYIEAFASPFTVNTMPEPTLHAFADHGEVKDLFPSDGGNAEQVLAEFVEAGIDVAALASRLQEEGKEAFNKSWEEMLKAIESQSGVTAG